MATMVDRWGRHCRRLCLFCVIVSLTGCGARGFAPDSVVENPGADAFLTQVGKQCGDLNVGTGTIAWLLESQDDVYFVDETTKLYFGDVSKAQYEDDISSFYPVGDSSRALSCIYAQLPKQMP